jgi:hypothetical protein
MNAGNIAETCRKLKVSRSAYQLNYEKDKEFALACDTVQEELLDLVESKAMELIREKNTQMIIFYLKTKGKSRGYIERTEVDERSTHEVRIVVRE